jgi:cyclophilin family peptidyl-prolyl cis-trans isomerase
VKKALAIAAVLLFIIGCGGQKTQQPVAPAPTSSTPAPETTAEVESMPAQTAVSATAQPGGALKDTLTADKLPANLFLSIKVKNYGTMKVSFFTKDAPKNVTNVANLAIKGFYNGLTFHRIIPGFVVQGGDPKGDGTGGPGYDVQAEIKHKHLKGSMSMARTGDEVNPQRRSSGSQFYLCLEALPQLDNQYTVIGDMVEGIDVLEQLGKVKTGAMDKPVEPVVMESVTVTTE